MRRRDRGVKDAYLRITSLDEYTGRTNSYFKESITFREARRRTRVEASSG